MGNDNKDMIQRILGRDLFERARKEEEKRGLAPTPPSNKQNNPAEEKKDSIQKKSS